MLLPPRGLAPLYADNPGSASASCLQRVSCSAEALAIIGYKGSCRPRWVMEVRKPYDGTTQKGDVAYAAVSLPTSACVGKYFSRQICLSSLSK